MVGGKPASFFHSNRVYRSFQCFCLTHSTKQSKQKKEEKKPLKSTAAPTSVSWPLSSTETTSENSKHCMFLCIRRLFKNCDSVRLNLLWVNENKHTDAVTAVCLCTELTDQPRASSWRTDPCAGLRLHISRMTDSLEKQLLASNHISLWVPIKVLIKLFIHCLMH